MSCWFAVQPVLFVYSKTLIYDAFWPLSWKFKLRKKLIDTKVAICTHWVIKHKYNDHRIKSCLYLLFSVHTQQYVAIESDELLNTVHTLEDAEASFRQGLWTKRTVESKVITWKKQSWSWNAAPWVWPEAAGQYPEGAEVTPVGRKLCPVSADKDLQRSVLQPLKGWQIGGIVSLIRYTTHTIHVLVGLVCS